MTDMTATIARKELTEIVRDGRLRWVGGILLGLVAVALLLGWRRHEDLNRQHRTAQEATRSDWLSQGRKNPHSAAHYGVYAFKPKLPLGLVDTGTEAYTGVAVWLEAHRQNEFRYRPAQDATMLARFGELTAATVMQILVPLLIIMMTFSAFAGEREQGTLRQLMSLGVPASKLALGKALGIGGGLALFLIPAAVLGAGALTVAGGAGWEASWARAGWMVLTYLLYFSVFTTISLAVSARVRTPGLSLVILLAFWIFNCLVAPRAVVDLAKQAHPTPSAFEFSQVIANDIADGMDGHSSSGKRTQELREKVLKQYGVTSIAELPVGFSGIALQAGEDYGNAVFDKRYGELWDAFEQQDRWQSWAGVVAPLLVVRPLSMGLAGTDFAQHRHFATAAESYRRVLNRKMNEELREHGAGRSDGHIMDEEFWKEVPGFSYTAPNTAWVIRNHAISLGLLVVWTAATAAACYLATARLRVD